MKDIRKVTQVNICDAETGDYLDSVSIHQDKYITPTMMENEIANVRKQYDSPSYKVTILDLSECTNCFNRWDGNAQCDCTVDSDTEKEDESEPENVEDDKLECEEELEIMVGDEESGYELTAHMVKKQKIEPTRTEIMETLFKKYFSIFEEIKNEHPVDKLTPQERGKLMLWVADKIANSVFLKYIKLKMN
jgi:hypothetical protein